MSRTAIWWTVALVALSTLGVLWFFDNFEQVTVKRHEAMQEEALRNPLLAAQRMLDRLGRKTAPVRSPGALDAIGEGGVLILENGRQRSVDAARAARLLGWVERGGYLIVESELGGEDLILQRLGVTLSDAHSCDAEAEDEADCGGAASARRRVSDSKPTVEVMLPGAAARYRIETIGPGLSVGAQAPVWRAGRARGDNQILHFALGRGQVTVLSALDGFAWARIGEFDHAELLWALLQRYQPEGTVHLAVHLETPTLWQWLGESAWMALVSGGVLLLVWLWRIVPRFGGTRAAPEAVRRELVQHLLAVGRCLWREGGLEALRTAVRREIGQRLSLRHPALARRLSGERHAALARMSGVPVDDVKAALAGEQAPSPENFTRTMQTLQRIERKL